jgi:3D (Asp-Asp-Asp) domain-containing protein
MFSCAREVVLTNEKPITQRFILRIAGLAAVAAFAVSLQYQPSAALPLFSSDVAGNRESAHASFVPTSQQRALVGTLPHNAIRLRDVHSLLTTPKLDHVIAMSEMTDVESLSIHTEVRTRREILPLRPIVRFTADMAPGNRKIARRGVHGITVVTERLTLWNSVIVDRQLLSRIVVRRPEPELIVSGPPRNLAEAMAVTGIHKLVAEYAMVATAYTAGSAQAVPTGRTATGLPAHYGVVAVDPRVIRLGSRLFIDGYGAAIAADTGGAIHGNRIDLCMDSLRSAINFGRQPVKVYVLQE